MTDYYKLLGVTADATPEQIQAAYLEKAKRFHPDQYGQDPIALKHMEKLNQAVDTLCDPQRRAAYDEALRVETSTDWEPAPMERDVRGITFHADGTFSLGTQRIPPTIAMERVGFNGMSLDYDPSTAALSAACDGHVYYFRYRDGTWECLRPKSARVSSKRAKETPPPGAVMPRPKLTSLPLAVAPRPRWRKLALRAGLATATAVAFVTGGFMLADFFRSPEERPKLPLTPEELAAQLAKANHQQQAAREQQAINQKLDEQAAVARSELAAAEILAQKLEKGLDTWQGEVNRWQTLTESLQTSEDGSRLAAEENTLQAFAQLVEEHPQRADDVAELRREAAALIAPVRKAIENDSTTPPSIELVTKLKAKLDEITSGTEEARKPRTQLESMLETARILGKKSDKTLAQALNDYRREHEMKKAAELAKVREQQDAFDIEQAAMKEKREREIARLEERQRQAAEERRRRDQIEREKEIAEAKSKEVQEALAFFFTPGILQPHGGGVRNEPEKKPISLTGLRALGALNATHEGLQALYSVVCHVQDTDRPRWGSETNIEYIQKAEYQRLVKAQDYLSRLGDTLVELGKLSP